MNTKRTKFQHNSNWIMMILTVIAAALLFIMVVDIAMDKFPLKIDLTPNRVLNLTEETKSILKGLDKDVHIIVFSTPDNELRYVNEILDRYERESSRITWETIDPVRNPSFISKYSSIGNTIMMNSIVIESGNKFKLIQAYDVFPMDKQGNAGATIDAEGVITSAITYVISDKNLKVGYVQGHAETDIAGNLAVPFKNAFIDYQPVSLLATEVPDDISYLMIVGPRVDFQPVEIEHLDQYLKKGKALQVLYAIDAPALPKLDDYLDEWGIIVNRDIIKESDANKIFGNNPNQIIGQFLYHEITNSAIENQIPTVLPMVRSITKKWDDEYDVKLESIIKSSSTSFAKMNPLSKVEGKEEGDITGPLDIAVLATRTYIENNQPVEAGSIFAIGSANIYDEKFLDNNTALLLSAINTQTKYNQSVVKPKSLSPAGLSMNLSDIYLWSIVVVFVIPLFILIWGLIVWMRRRHL